MRDRRQFLAGVGAVGLAAAVKARPRRYTISQLLAACRKWLKSHHVKGWATVTIIPGDGPPPPALLDPATGQGWRHAPTLGAWVSPAFNVSWSAGDVIPSFESTFSGQDVQLYVGDWDVGSDVALADLATGASLSDFGAIRSTGDGAPSGDATASSSGSGVAFVVQSDPPLSRRNLIPNPSFENGTEGWALGGPGTFAIDTTHVVSGSSSLKGNSSSGASQASTDLFPVDPSTVYTMSMYWDSDVAFDSDPDLTLRLSVVWYAANRRQIGSAVNGPAAHVQPRVSLTAVSPDTAAFAAFYFDAENNSDPSAHYWFDAAQFEEGPTASAYFDGSAPSDGGYTYTWSGSPNASASVCSPTVPPAPTAGPADPGLDATVLLGTQVVVDSTFTYPPEDVDGAGDDGDYWLDGTGQAFYGPKASGRWPDEPAVASFKLTQLVR